MIFFKKKPAAPAPAPEKKPQPLPKEAAAERILTAEGWRRRSQKNQKKPAK